MNLTMFRHVLSPLLLVRRAAGSVAPTHVVVAALPLRRYIDIVAY